jgi:hypothetical protein
MEAYFPTFPLGISHDSFHYSEREVLVEYVGDHGGVSGQVCCLVRIYSTYHRYRLPFRNKAGLRCGYRWDLVG